MLGCYVPQPEIPPNDANPRGYFEPKWAVAYHKKVLAQAGVRTLDGRPGAADLMAAVTSDPDLLLELREWFATQLVAPQIVVKDPRTSGCVTSGPRRPGPRGRTSWLTMLRHPAEVVDSRDMHYLKDADDDRRLARETGNLAGWVNVALTNERHPAGQPARVRPLHRLIERLAHDHAAVAPPAGAPLRRRPGLGRAPPGRRLHRREPAPVPAHPGRPRRPRRPPGHRRDRLDGLDTLAPIPEDRAAMAASTARRGLRPAVRAPVALAQDETDSAVLERPAAGCAAGHPALTQPRRPDSAGPRARCSRAPAGTHRPPRPPLRARPRA